jgi:hypothetical protein
MPSDFLRFDTFSVHVFGALPKSSGMPRCHVRRGDGDPETVVDLPFVQTIAGPSLSPEELKAIFDHLQELLNEWARKSD